ncbi:MAG: hypothetical protein GEU28_10015 [Dehalococcoidia bacterium]|nr:hypothetical protein [Dehalococcoidia bacterium]
MSVLKLGVILPLAAGVVIAVFAHSLTAQSGSDPGEPNAGESSYPPEIAPDPDDPAVEAAKAAIDRDNAEPRFEGATGDFDIVGRDGMSNFPCSDGPQQATAEEALGSELHFLDPLIVGFNGPGPTGGPSVGKCEGVVNTVAGDFTEGLAQAYVVRSYFVNERAQLPLDVPTERLELTEVEGRPGLLELPNQDLVPGCRLFVIERASEPERPGILLEVSGGLTCDAARDVAVLLLTTLGEEG